MKCPCCAEDHILSAEDLPPRPSGLFAPCPDCRIDERAKDLPVLPDEEVPGPCACNRRFLDHIMAAVYRALYKQGVLSGQEPLSALGTPLISPGIFMRRPPVLPPRSLLLISGIIPDTAAEFLYHEIPELLGIVRPGTGIPGTGDLTGDSSAAFRESSLLCGCDVRADLFSGSRGPVVIVKKQAALHIEFPKGIDPKIISVEEQVRRVRPDVFIDACAGPGTLGIAAALHRVPEVVLCDVWNPAVWSAVQSIHANRRRLGVTDVRIHADISDRPPVWNGTPVLIAEGLGAGIRMLVFHGSYEELGPLLPAGRRLTVFDPFDKASFGKNDSFLTFWKEKIGGEVFIP